MDQNFGKNFDLTNCEWLFITFTWINHFLSTTHRLPYQNCNNGCNIKSRNKMHKLHIVDTWFYTHDLIKEDDYNDHSCTLKIMIALHASIYSGITCINSFIAYHKNDLEILTVTMVCSVSKLDHRIERYRIIKFARSACIVSR